MPLQPRGEQIKRLVESDLDGPVVMLNLLKYEKLGGAAGSASSGEESYKRYGDEVSAHLERVGARLIWRGRGDSVVIGDDEADGWDAVLLVEYPSRKAFLEMVSQKEYEGVAKHRTAALVDSRLIAMTEQYRAK